MSQNVAECRELSHCKKILRRRGRGEPTQQFATECSAAKRYYAMSGTLLGASSSRLAAAYPLITVDPISLKNV
jgi:hypothetical protein